MLKRKKERKMDRKMRQEGKGKRVKTNISRKSFKQGLVRSVLVAGLPLAG